MILVFHHIWYTILTCVMEYLTAVIAAMHAIVGVSICISIQVAIVEVPVCMTCCALSGTVNCRIDAGYCFEITVDK